MKVSLKTKVSLFVTLVIIIISVVSTYLFISTHTRSKEKGRIIRGVALGYALSKAAEEGLVAENLDLLKKAAYIVQAEDVILAQVYSNIWEAIDAYPLERLKDLPHPDAVRHFKDASSPVHVTTDNGYDFYNPILFKVSEDSSPTIIGFVRIVLSSSTIKKELKEIVFTNIIVAAIITLFAIISINILISRIVLRPVMSLHRSISMFKDDKSPDTVPVYSDDEIGELAVEFNKMSSAVKEKTDRLIESEKRIKSLFERVEHAIFRLDKDGNIIEANQRFYDMFGIINNLCALLMSEQKGKDCLLKTFSGKMIHIEERAMGKHGNELVVLLSLYPDTDSNGNIISYDGYIIDITEKKRLEENLLQSQKMEAIGALAGGIAHDFNNLLSAILGYSSFVKEQIDESHPYYKSWEIVEQAALRGTELTGHLLALSRKQTEIRVKAPVEINELIMELISLLSRTFTKSIAIDTRLLRERSYVLGDSNSLYQAFLNICLNARDAMPRGGRLFIETSRFKASNAIFIGRHQASAGPYIQVNITDTGMGIDKNVIDRIFEPFFTTKEIGRGTGMGLAITHKVIREHQGFIDVYSELGKGTTFKLYLPSYKDEVAKREKEPEAIEAAVSELGILVVDDEEPIRKLCEDILEAAKYKVFVAGDGFEAVKIFEDKKDLISLVILDVIMPGMSSREIINRVLTIKPSAGIIITSGFGKETVSSWIDEKGIIGFIPKPYRAQVLLKKIKEALVSYNKNRAC